MQCSDFASRGEIISLQSRIQEIERQLGGTLRQSDEPRIVQASYQQTLAYINPQTEGLTTAIATVQAAVGVVQGIVNGLGAGIQGLFNVIADIFSRLGALGGQIGEVYGEFSSVLEKIQEVKTIASEGRGLGQLNASKIIQLTNQIQETEKRFDDVSSSLQKQINGLQKQVDKLSTEFSKNAKEGLKEIEKSEQRQKEERDKLLKALEKSFNQSVKDLDKKINNLQPESLREVERDRKRIGDLEKLTEKAKKDQEDIKRALDKVDQTNRETIKSIDDLKQNQTSQKIDYDQLKEGQKQNQTTTKTTIERIQKQTNDNSTSINNVTTNIINKVENNVTQIINNFKNEYIDMVDLRPVLQAIALVPGQTEARLRPPIDSVDRRVGYVQQQTTAEQQRTNAASGVCQTTQPGGCLGREFQGVNQRLGDPIGPGGLSRFLGDRFTALWNSKVIDRALMLLNLGTSVHNAAMLSKNLGDTLVQVTSNLLAVIGIKDPQGNPFDIGQVLGNTTEGLLKRILGAENYKELNKTWRNANRVYQAAANVAWSVVSIADNTRASLDTIIEHSGKIGNALKKAAVILDNDLPWLTEKLNARSRIQKKIDELASTVIPNVQSAADMLDEVSSNVLSVQESVTEIKTQRKELEKSINDFQTDINQKQTQAKADSQSPDINPVDLIIGDDDLI